MPLHQMHPDLRTVYEALRAEVTWLHARWISYSQLFGKSQKRVDMLNECARSLFFFIHETLANDLLLSLCKLTDPASQGEGKGRKENLSLNRLQERLEEFGEALLAAECKVTLKEININAEPLKVLRNKQLAHIDLAVALEQSAQPLPQIAKHQIDEAMQLVRQYLNSIETYYNNNVWRYEHFMMVGTDGDALVDILRDGLRYDQLLQEEVIPYSDQQKSVWTDA